MFYRTLDWLKFKILFSLIRLATKILFNARPQRLTFLFSHLSFDLCAESNDKFDTSLKKIPFVYFVMDEKKNPIINN